MEKELNIAAILKDKPQNTRLWSPIFGDVYLKGVDGFNDNKIRVTHHGTDNAFLNNGKVWADGGVCLFPSRWMDDWQKFAWKKGDVLSCGVDNLCIFNKWENEEYVEFEAEFVTPGYAGARLNTAKWSKVTDENIIKQYISKIEEIKGGKLNLETLEIEHPKQEFKDGDILVSSSRYTYIFIYKKENEYNNPTGFYVSLNLDGILSFNNRIVEGKDLEFYIKNIRLATEKEKQRLFSALEKKGKVWNSETKQIEDLPKKCELKPFDKVLAKFDENCEWMPDFFYYYDKTDSEMPYVCIANGRAIECIPYNEKTAHLLGTTDEWKGGEG